MPAPLLIISAAPTIAPAFLVFTVLLALCFGQYVAGLFVPRRYRLSNMRAMMRSCRSSSASTAESCSRPHPRTHPGVTTAVMSEPPASTPDPSPTPQHADWARTIVCEPGQWWQQPRYAPSAVGHPHQTTRSPQTTQCPGRKAEQTAHCGQRTDHATAGQGHS